MPACQVVFHGSLEGECPSGLRLDASTAAELISGVSRQVKALAPTATGGRRTIRLDGFPTVESLYAPLAASVVHIWPVDDQGFSGAKSGGLAKIVLGTVLVAVAVWNPMGWAAGGMALSTLYGAGISMTLGGILEVISPAPKIDLNGSEDPEASKYLGAPKNTVKIGTRIPLIYGEHMAYGHYLSFDIDAKDLSIEGTPAPAPTVPTYDNVTVTSVEPVLVGDEYGDTIATYDLGYEGVIPPGNYTMTWQEYRRDVMVSGGRMRVLNNYGFDPDTLPVGTAVGLVWSHEIAEGE